VVIHAAATTDFLDDPAEIHELNVTGTQHVIEFAKAARASLIYVSTAFVDRLGDALSSGVENEAALGRNAYLESKLASEALVRSSDLRHVIVRPSVVIGDSSSAHIARPQGLHMMLKAFCSGTLPFIPMAAGSSIDFLPQDLVAAEIAQIANSGAAPAPKGPVWLTAGPSAVSVEEMVRCCRIAMKGGGVKVSEPRYFDQETLDRLIVPAFVEALPEDVERRMWNFLALTTLFSTATPFTSSLAAGREASIRHKSLIAALERTIDRYCLPDPNKVTGRVGVSA
jgi:thioester reductase-like protein